MKKQNVKLIEFSIKDFAILKKQIPNAEFLLQWAGPEYTYPLTWEQMKCKIDEKDNDGEKKTWLYTAVNDTGNIPVGHIQLSTSDKINKIAKVGSVLIFTEWRGLGYGKALMKSVLNICFNDKKMNESQLGVFDFNKTAIKCYKQIGFKEYAFEHNAREINGKKWNLIRMKMDKTEYEKKNLQEKNMVQYQTSICGLDCQACDWREAKNCGGCKETKGEPFYGSCRLATCVKKNGFADCSYCPNLPCPLLTEFSFDKKHGDSGQRIEILKKLRETRD